MKTYNSIKSKFYEKKYANLDTKELLTMFANELDIDKRNAVKNILIKRNILKDA